MKLLLSKMRSRRYTGFAVLLTAVMFAAVLCIAPATADAHDESGSDEIWIPDAEDSDVPEQIDDGKVNGDEAVPQSSTSMVYRGPVYDPANFTITASGPDLSPEELFESANATLNTYTALFGKTVAPIALSESCLSPDSLNLRKKLPVGALSASPVSEGYIGLPDVEVPDGKKLAAYSFRVLPTGQTMVYASIVSSDANDAAYASAAEELNEWMNTDMNEKTKDAGTSIVACAAGLPTVVSDSLKISEMYTPKYYEENTEKYGEVNVKSSWYWDKCGDLSNKHDYFYATAEVIMNPGILRGGAGNKYKNHQMTIEMDALLHPSALPKVYMSDAIPNSISGKSSISCSIGTGGAGLSWTQELTDVTVARTDIAKWDLKFTGTGNDEVVYSFKSGMEIGCSQTARDGREYCLSTTRADACNAFHTGNLFDKTGPSVSGLYHHSLYIRWDGDKYIEEE